LYGAENWTFRKVDQKYLKSFKTWYWRKMKKISCTDRVRKRGNVYKEPRRRGIL